MVAAEHQAVRPGLDAPYQRLTDVDQPPGDDHHLRVEHMHEVGHANRRPAAELVENDQGVGISLGDQGVDVLSPDGAHRAGLGDGAVEVAPHRGLAGQAAQAGAGRVVLPWAAGARDVLRARHLNGHVTRLAREAVPAPVQPPVEHEPRSQPGAQRDQGNMPAAAARAVERLRPGRSSRLILDHHGPSPLRAQAAAEVEIQHAVDVGRVPEHPVGVDQPGDPHADGRERAAALVFEGGDHPDDRVDQRVAVGCGRVAPHRDGRREVVGVNGHP